jgi:hypothetical protein
LFSDARRIRLGVEGVAIGMQTIKERRLRQLRVQCHPTTFVGQYVPFYFCPRSIMLYIIYMANHPELSYRGGQRPIVHLQFDLHRVAAWADSTGLPWAYTDRNAATRVAHFYNDLSDLDKLNWQAIVSTDFTQSVTKEEKQAEFLIYDQVAWELVERIGVIDAYRKQQVATILKAVDHLPDIVVERDWYY